MKIAAGLYFARTTQWPDPKGLLIACQFAAAAGAGAFGGRFADVTDGQMQHIPVAERPCNTEAQST